MRLFVGPHVEWRLLFLKFYMFHAVSHHLFIIEEIHRSPLIIAPRYLRLRCWIYAQDLDSSTARACNHPILFFLSRDY